MVLGTVSGGSRARTDLACLRGLEHILLDSTAAPALQAQQKEVSLTLFLYFSPP